MTEVQRFVRAWRPKAAEHWDTVETSLAALDEVSALGAEPTVVSFGAPTRRREAEGFWTWPVTVTVGDTVVGTVTPSPERGWDGATVVGDVKVLDVSRASGHHGGYVTLKLAVPEGATVVHGSPL